MNLFNEVHKIILKELDNFFSEQNDLTHHKDFIYQWIEDNIVEFCSQEDLEELADLKKLAELLNLTAVYLSTKNINNVHKIMFGTFKPNRILTELKPRVTKHLQSALNDLNSIFASSEKTKQAIKSLEMLISEIDDIVPLREYYSENVEDIRNYMRQQNFTQIGIENYIQYFQNPYKHIKTIS